VTNMAKIPPEKTDAFMDLVHFTHKMVDGPAFGS